MATLELVPLRSRHPHSGRMTLRYTMPVIGSEPLSERTDLDLDDALRAVLLGVTDTIDSAEDLHGADSNTSTNPSLEDLEAANSTTPQVEGPTGARETTAGKGRQAR